MINLLPPTVKRQLWFARINARLVYYVGLVAIVLLILGGIFAGSIFYMNLSREQAQKSLALTEQEIAEYSEFQAQAGSLRERVAAIKAIQGSQTRFSLLLEDLAKVLPKGTSLDGITLTGDDKKPVRLLVTANSYESGLAFRDALLLSPRISGADLESITPGTNGFATSVVIGFNPGLAK